MAGTSPFYLAAAWPGAGRLPLANGTAIWLLRCDNPHISNVFAYNYNRGIRLSSSPAGTPHKVHLQNADFDGCVTRGPHRGTWPSGLRGHHPDDQRHHTITLRGTGSRLAMASGWKPIRPTPWSRRAICASPIPAWTPSGSTPTT